MEKPNKQLIQRIQVLETKRMSDERNTNCFWKALYELWRLSWYETTFKDTVPRCIPIYHWLAGINTSAFTNNNNENINLHSSDPDGGNISSISNDNDQQQQQRPMSIEELIHVAGGLLTSLMISQRFFGNSFAYSITIHCALQIQNFLCQNVKDQRLRPGKPNSSDQLKSLLIYYNKNNKTPYYTNLSNLLVLRHELHALNHLHILFNIMQKN